MGDSKVTRLVIHWDNDLGLSPEGDAAD